MRTNQVPDASRKLTNIFELRMRSNIINAFSFLRFVFGSRRGGSRPGRCGAGWSRLLAAPLLKPGREVRIGFEQQLQRADNDGIELGVAGEFRVELERLPGV